MEFAVSVLNVALSIGALLTLISLRLLRLLWLSLLGSLMLVRFSVTIHIVFRLVVVWLLVRLPIKECNMANQKNEKIDWQTCALALNRKLDLLTARLQQAEHTSTLFDVVSFSRSLREEFHLETGSDFVKPDFIALQRKYDEIGHLIHQLRYAPLSKRDALLNQLLKLDSEFGMDLAIQGAFV